MLDSSHLKHIDAAIKELLALSKSTADPAPIPDQFVGTVVDNAACLLTAPANALDGKTRILIPTEDRTWLSMMQAVHRAFLASLQTAIEGGLAHICGELRLKVVVSGHARSTGLVARIKEKVDSAPIQAELREIERMGSSQPSFDDYLNPVLQTCFGSDERRRTWRRFFRALSIARNKASHFDTQLSPAEREEMNAGGLRSMVDESGALQINPRVYAQLARLSLDFFDEAVRRMRQPEPAG